jgi:hypothetical protein
MTRINVNVYPKEGYFFVEADGVHVRGDSWKDVIARVTDYRRRNRMPAGDPDAEIMAQACARNPSICSEKRAAPIKRKTLKGRILEWLSAIKRVSAKEPLEFVDADTAKRRANVCVGCPQHVDFFGAPSCASCKATVKAMREELLKGRKPDPRLNGCAAIGIDCAVAAHLDEARIEAPEAPRTCWRKINGGS